ncbi:MAG: single-stranded DNA-binding protein [Methylococcales bacterium]
MSNVFSFTGTVGRDAEVKQLASGQTVLNVTVANNIGYGERQQTLWIRVAVWGKRAEGKLGDYLKKGQQVFVSGELSQREYQANDGTTKSSLELNCNIIDLVGKRDSSAPAPASASAPAQKKEPTTFDDFDNVPF